MKKLLKAAKIVESLSNFGELKQYGFFPSYCGVWVNKKSKVVIKTPGIFHYKTPPCAVYTRRVKNDNLTGFQIFIQPLVNTKRKVKAMRQIIAKYKTTEIGKDCHEHNVGHYRNKAVMFDW